MTAQSLVAQGNVKGQRCFQLPTHSLNCGSQHFDTGFVKWAYRWKPSFLLLTNTWAMTFWFLLSLPCSTHKHKLPNHFETFSHLWKMLMILFLSIKWTVTVLPCVWAIVHAQEMGEPCPCFLPSPGLPSWMCDLWNHIGPHAQKGPQSWFSTLQSLSWNP